MWSKWSVELFRIKNLLTKAARPSDGEGGTSFTAIGGGQQNAQYISHTQNGFMSGISRQSFSGFPVAPVQSRLGQSAN
jgi:hypothetical protein